MEQNVIPQKNVTYDYSIFKRIVGNRSVKKIQKLKKSIMTEDLTMHYPILVTSDYEIIDGQHRFEVCKQLGKPIYYEFADCKDPSIAIRMLNVSSKVWQTEDFLNFYVKNGCDVYIKFEAFMNGMGFKISNAIILFTDNKINTGQFKEGKLKDYTHDTAKAVKFLWDIKNTIPKDLWGYRAFVTAVNRYVNTLDDRKITKLKKKNHCHTEICKNRGLYHGNAKSYKVNGKRRTQDAYLRNKTPSICRKEEMVERVQSEKGGMLNFVRRTF